MCAFLKLGIFKIGILFLPLVQELDKESAKAISLQVDDPSKLLEWNEDSEVMGECLNTGYVFTLYSAVCLCACAC